MAKAKAAVQEILHLVQKYWWIYYANTNICYVEMFSC